MRRNPLREHTNQMLPETVGKFDFGYSWSGNERLCKIGKKTIKEIRPLRGPLEGQFQEIIHNVETITLPDKSEVVIKKIGKGHATTAYMGEDDWVYLITSTASGDKSKEILSEFRGSPAAMKHIPFCERIGFITKRNGDEFDVFRMPFYRKIKATDKKAYKQLKIINSIYETMAKSTWYKPKANEPFEQMFAEELEKDTKLDPDVREAMKELCEHLMNYDGNWKFEFPTRNVSVDQDGNIVFLDVFFNQRALDQFRGRFVIGRQLRMNPPSEGFKWHDAGYFSDIFDNGYRVEAIVTPNYYGSIDLSKDILVSARDKVSDNARRFIPDLFRKRIDISKDGREEFIYEMPLYEECTEYSALDNDKVISDKAADPDDLYAALSKYFHGEDLDGIIEALVMFRREASRLGLKYINDIRNRNLVKQGDQLILLDTFYAEDDNCNKLKRRWRNPITSSIRSAKQLLKHLTHRR